MLSTAQENAVRQWTVNAIAADADLEPIPLARVVWTGQDFPDRDYPYALLTYTGSAEDGISPATRVEPNDDTITTDTNVTTVSIEVVTKVNDSAPTRDQTAAHYVRAMKPRARSFEGEILDLADLAVRDINVVPYVGRLQGRSQWERRATIDLSLLHSIEVTEQPGVITQSEVIGTTTPATSAQQTLIP